MRNEEEEEGRSSGKGDTWTKKDDAYFATMRKEFFNPLQQTQNKITENIGQIRTDMERVVERMDAL